MSTLSEQLEQATRPFPPSAGGLLVKVANLRSADYPGRDAHGVLPVIVTGHEAMSEHGWKRWVRETGMAHYGSGYVERVLLHGVDLKEMGPTMPFGRAMRLCTERKWKSEARRWTELDSAAGLLDLVEKWPSLYNSIAEEMAEEQVTLREFMDRVYNMPTPREYGEGRYTTLGDIIGRGVMLLPDF